MKRDDLIQKWLDHSLTPQELEAFKKLEDYEALTRLSSHLKHYKAPEYNTSVALDNVLLHLDHSKSKSKPNIFKQLLKVAAILAVCFGLYFYTTTLDTTINTAIAQKTTITLPDASLVTINAKSTLTYNEYDWDDDRIIDLEGEAYFKVAKGKTFKVNTKEGVVEVLGTEFNVKQRNDIFEVICYEGLVAVTQNNTQKKLYPGDTFLIVDGKQIVSKKEESQQPSWITHESSFRSIPFKEVIAEFERQYNVSITYNTQAINTKILFTGRFTHKNMDIALKSITLPLHLRYSKTDDSIILKRDQE